ncbi:hypothetical protein TTHERM_01344730 (macronuclear) [Tetrahymena thermophila SB210]|uniref:Uncharacterized protein n=1 Tax=Tetrahymena thermophila (strain SB210) TaxID=312017 RepID=Q24FR7_TETTS|nr:hypothetical protein TTHERM_01344730 [Tetrahymena thermophila SB210]EAS06628.4 hypothetical protein TTHERM_01344730 [Tetrahymena thermophila SB210]|eukprot:XP_001026873.4 hypothetical protein TTHERM_01344730 [Tetrahymena thermophila SB210]
MGNYQSNYPERMLKLKNFQDLNNDIDEFNTKQLNQKAMDALGFLIQFEEINYGGFKGLFKKIFFQQALSKIDINTNMLLDNKPYFFKLRVNEMYALAELLGRYTEDADSMTNQDLTQAQIQALSQIKIGRNANNNNNKQNPSQASNQNEEEEEQKQGDNISTQQKQTNQQNQISQEEEDKQCPLCLDKRIQIVLPCLVNFFLQQNKSFKSNKQELKIIHQIFHKYFHQINAFFVENRFKQIILQINQKSLKLALNQLQIQYQDNIKFLDQINQKVNKQLNKQNINWNNILQLYSLNGQQKSKQYKKLQQQFQLKTLKILNLKKNFMQEEKLNSQIQQINKQNRIDKNHQLNNRQIISQSQSNNLNKFYAKNKVNMSQQQQFVRLNQKNMNINQSANN